MGIGWVFNVTLRQNFNYIDYPLDHKTIWVRLRSTDFDNNKLLLPALNNYKSTDLGDKFGLDENIVIGDWQVNETFFDYKQVNYTSNFGLSTLATQSMSHPELNFNIVLKRKFLNAFIIHLVPLITVAVLLFSLLLTVTSDTNKKETFGFNYMGVISIVAALFFVVVLSHIQLRQQFSENGIVYIEYFFLLMYFLMMSLIFNTYRFTRNIEQKSSWLTLHDHLWPKLLFWPLTLGVMAVVTLFKFT